MHDRPHLPVELLLAVVDQAQWSFRDMPSREHRLTMSRLSLVCKALREHSQRCLFQRLSYSGLLLLSSDYYQSRGAWHDLLREGDPEALRVAGHVHECTLKHGELDSDSGLMGEVVLTVMPHFRALEKLTVTDTDIYGDLAVVFASMPFLRAVKFELCWFHEDPASHTNCTPPLSVWRSITFKESHDLSPEWTRFFQKTLDMGNLEALSSQSWPFYSTLLRDQAAPRLKELDIFLKSQDSFHELAAVLINTPCLLRLSIIFTPGVSDTLHPFPPDVIPSLQELSVSRANVASCIVPGRPVTSLRITNPHPGHTAEAFLAVVKVPAAFVRELTISSVLIKCLRQEDWPALRTLTVYSEIPLGVGVPLWPLTSSPIYTVVEWIYQVPHMHRHQCLALQTQLIEIETALSRAFPNAKLFRYGKLVEWRRDRQCPRQWRPNLLSRSLLNDWVARDEYRKEWVDDFLDTLESF